MLRRFLTERLSFQAHLLQVHVIMLCSQDQLLKMVFWLSYSAPTATATATYLDASATMPIPISTPTAPSHVFCCLLYKYLDAADYATIYLRCFLQSIVFIGDASLLQL